MWPKAAILLPVRALTNVHHAKSMYLPPGRGEVPNKPMLGLEPMRSMRGIIYQTTGKGVRGLLHIHIYTYMLQCVYVYIVWKTSSQPITIHIQTVYILWYRRRYRHTDRYTDRCDLWYRRTDRSELEVLNLNPLNILTVCTSVPWITTVCITVCMTISTSVPSNVYGLYLYSDELRRLLFLSIYTYA
jgi:hypothetical protein